MEAVFPFLCFGGIALIVVLSIVFSASQRSAMSDAWKRVAAQFRGHYIDGGWFGFPRLNLLYHGMPISVDVYSTGGKHKTYYTQLHAPFPYSYFSLELFPEGLFQSIGKMFGTQDIEIGSPQFDAQFIIQGYDAGAIASYLHPGVQTHVWNLTNLLGNGDLYISIAGGRMLVRKMGQITDEYSLGQFIQSSMALIPLQQPASPGETAGVEFVEAIDESSYEAAQPRETPTCQVCGEKAAEDVVICSRCQTPHHRECWRYLGQCSTYGCGGTDALPAAPGWQNAPVKPPPIR